MAEPAVDYLGTHDIESSNRPVVSDRWVEAVLLDESERAGVQLLALGEYGSSRVSEFFLGSTTRHVLKDTRIPLWLSQ